MTDPISGLAGRIGSSGVTATGDAASRLSALREAMQRRIEQGPSGAGGVQGGDAPRSQQVDIGKGSDGSFGDTLTRLINQVSASQDHATDSVDRFVRGEPVELHQVMAATEEAGIALEVLVELRNKLTEAYRTLINMQS